MVIFSKRILSGWAWPAPGSADRNMHPEIYNKKEIFDRKGRRTLPFPFGSAPMTFP